MATETSSTGRTSDKFMLRVPDGMRAQLKAAAEANNRTMNAEIVARLEESFEGRALANEVIAAQMVQSSEVLKLRLEQLVQQRGALGLGVLIAQELITELTKKAGVSLKRSVAAEMTKIASEATAAVEAAREAVPDEAVAKLQAAQARANELQALYAKELAAKPSAGSRAIPAFLRQGNK